MKAERRLGQTLRALALPVGGSMLLSVAGLCVAHRVLPASALEASNDVVGNYLQTVGSIYAVLLAFVVFVVWNQFNDARNVVETEANEILDLHRVAAGLAAPTVARVRELSRAYLDAVLDIEWPAMAGSGLDGPGESAVILDQMWAVVHDADPTGCGDPSAYREVLKRLDDISDARSNRLTASRTRIPLAMRVLLYSGALTMIGSMYLFAVRSFAVHATITALLAGAISHVLFIIEDLDNCFGGSWQVSRAAFVRVRAQIGAAPRADEKAAAGRPGAPAGQ